MSQKLPADDFKWIEKGNLSKFNEEFIKNYDKESDIGYILEVDTDYPKSLCKLHSDLPFLPERKIINKFSNLVNTSHDKKKLCYSYSSFKASIKS